MKGKKINQIFLVLIFWSSPYTIPACLRLEYVTAIPIPSIPNAKKPGTIKITDAPHELELYKSPFVTATVLTWVAIGPIKETPISMETNPPIKFAIIFS